MTGDRAEAHPGTGVVWLLFGVIVIVPYVQWVDGLGPAKPLNAYTVFPLLGLWAWSLMWTHYAYGALRILHPRFAPSPIYQRLSGALVLALILAHPGVLIVGLLLDTNQWPPVSYVNYAGAGRGQFVVLGTIALLAFLGYEVLERLSLRGRMGGHWRWVSLAQIAAMALVFVHGLRLGRHLDHDGWFRLYWIVLGALFVPCAAVVGRADWRVRDRAPRTVTRQDA